MVIILCVCMCVCVSVRKNLGKPPKWLCKSYIWHLKQSNEKVYMIALCSLLIFETQLHNKLFLLYKGCCILFAATTTASSYNVVLLRAPFFLLGLYSVTRVCSLLYTTPINWPSPWNDIIFLTTSLYVTKINKYIYIYSYIYSEPQS